MMIVDGKQSKRRTADVSAVLESIWKGCAGKLKREMDLKQIEKKFPAAMDAFAKQGVDQCLLVFPRSLPAKYAKDLIPGLVQRAKQAHPELDFHYMTLAVQ
ncbi:MAG: hypothetical protein PHN49_09945 [Candidatus Omnitrophica bacterium]|nr:hypothetical protein [Candidatus Omnitrophota bacterium]MDD5671951.1 hypothetical protein [Candidatus Omnitrophota bacterium]